MLLFVCKLFISFPLFLHYYTTTLLHYSTALSSRSMSSESETVDEVLARDLRCLQSLSDEQLQALLQLVIGFLIDSKGSDFQDKLGVYAETHGQGLGGSVLKSMVRASLLFLQRGVRAGWSEEQVLEACSGMGLSEECGVVVGRCWAQQSSNLTSTLLSKIVSANQLMDVDWSFGVTAATDDCDQVHTLK